MLRFQQIYSFVFYQICLIMQEPFTSTQSAQLYELLEPEIELYLEKSKIPWTDLVMDPTAYTDQEARETSVKLFYRAIRPQLLGESDV